MSDLQYFVYILKLENGRFYVGSTKDLYKRLLKHFRKGGAIATKESKPVEVVKVITLIDYEIGSDTAHNRLEVIVASRVARRYGADMVRGAKHGKGWNDQPSKNQLKTIEYYKRWAKKVEAKELRQKISFFDFERVMNDVKKKLAECDA